MHPSSTSDILSLKFRGVDGSSGITPTFGNINDLLQFQQLVIGYETVSIRQLSPRTFSLYLLTFVVESLSRQRTSEEQEPTLNPSRNPESFRYGTKFPSSMIPRTQTAVRQIVLSSTLEPLASLLVIKRNALLNECPVCSPFHTQERSAGSAEEGHQYIEKYILGIPRLR